jgi:predicted ester cyclase
MFMPTKYKTIIHEWFEEVWNQGDALAIDRLLGADTIVHGIVGKNGAVVRGPEGFKAFHSDFLNAFPDITVEVIDTVVEGDKMAARCLVSGTHSGNGLGFEPTGKKVEFTGMCIACVQNGKIVEAWNNFDFLTLYQQLDSLKLI